MLPYDATRRLLNTIYADYDRAVEIAPSVLPFAKKYFDALLMKHKGITGLLVYHRGTAELLVQNAQGLFAVGEAEDYTDMAPLIEQLRLAPVQLSNIVGFITGFKKEYMVFKTKQMDKRRHKGARCDQSGKSESLRVLNAIMEGTGIPESTLDSTRSVSQRGVCVRQELALRAFSAERRKDKTWFLRPAIGALIDIEKLSGTD
jgi:hypothetical protein